MARPKADAYNRIIERIFFDHYRKGRRSLEFSSDELRTAARALGLEPPRNPPDVLYSYRHRRQLPERVRATCEAEEEWVIRPQGGRDYRFVLVPLTDLRPRAGLLEIKIPDSTPEIVAQYALSDEQAVLAKVRYNRLVDLFTGVVTYSLQNHLRTQIDRKQMEIDELYLGVSKSGQQFVLPVQAKRGKDRLGRIQLEQDIAYCAARFPNLTCRPIAARSMDNDILALFELTVVDEAVKIIEERHYRLVPSSEITSEDLVRMGGRKSPRSGARLSSR